MAVWSCFSNLADESTQRYRDLLGVKYAYDSTVINHAQVSPGDLLVIRDDREVFGVGQVESVDSSPGVKRMQRCPRCHRSGPIRRATMSPQYRCSRCKSEFNDPVSEDMDVTRFEAWYAGTWSELVQPLPREVLSEVYAGKDRQNAIRRLLVDPSLNLLARVGSTGVVDLVKQVRSSKDAPAGGHIPATVKRRLGQAEFRQGLREVFGDRCAITGPQPPEILDAAHLYSFAESPQHLMDGGLLLRADLHRLYDAFLLTIDSATWSVQLAPGLPERFTTLGSIEGAPLTVAAELRPRSELVDAHRQECLRRWASTE